MASCFRRQTLLILILAIILPQVYTAECPIANHLLYFICLQCDSQNICPANSHIRDFTLRNTDQTPINVVGATKKDTECSFGCLYCYDYGTQICTVCSQKFQLIEGVCYELTQSSLDVVFQQITKEQPLTSSYLDSIQNTPVSARKSEAVKNYQPSTYTQGLSFIIVLALTIVVCHSKIQQLIRLFLNIQHLYQFSYINLSIRSSQKVLCFLNSLNFFFLNPLGNVLPDNYLQANMSKVYYIINIDSNLLRNAGGAILLSLVIMGLLPPCLIYFKIKKSKINTNLLETIFVFWSLLQNNIVYFSIFELIRTDTLSTNPKILLSLRIISAFMIVLFIVGQVALKKLFVPDNDPLKITNLEYLSLATTHTLLNILLVLADNGISEHFSFLVYIAYILVNYLLVKKHKNSHKFRFLVCQWYFMLSILSIILDLPPGLLIGVIWSYVLINLWDALCTKKQAKQAKSLELFHEQEKEEKENGLITEADIGPSCPTMKKISSSASTQV